MNGLRKIPDSRRSERLLRTAIALMLAGMVGAPAAQAASRKRVLLDRADVQPAVAWSHYLARGEGTWARRQTPAFTPSIRASIMRALNTETPARMMADPMVSYLLWRQSVNPQRFLLNHPTIAPALTRLRRPTVVIPSLTPGPEVAPQGVSDPVVSPGALPSAVPEPASWILAVSMTAVGLLWRHRLGRTCNS